MEEHISEGRMSRAEFNRYVKKVDAKTDISTLKRVDNILSLTKDNIESGKLNKAIYWCDYKTKWLQNENKSLDDNFYTYTRGDVIMLLDLGTLNMGTEIRYPHPCVVIHDSGEDWLIVAPITGVQRDKNNEIIVHDTDVYCEKRRRKMKNNKEFCFTKHSVIQVDQITRVSKHRIINKQKKSLREDLMNGIDNIMIQKYLPKKYELLQRLEGANQSLVNENLKLQEIIKEYEDRIKRLEYRVRDSKRK